MPALITEEFEDETIGEFCDHIDVFWLNALGGIVLGLIVQVTTSPIAIYEKSMNKKAMQTIFCSVFTFNHVTNELSLNLKDIVRIKKKTSSNPLTPAYIQPHNYNQDSNEENTKIPPLSLLSSIVCSLAFVRLANDTNNIFRKLFVTLPAHQARIINNRNELQKEHSNTLGE